jgi:GNAT superfamily N-acetyltransferase
VSVLSIKTREVDEGLFDDEIYLCLPPRDSPKYAAFEGRIEKKRSWLKKRKAELGSVAQIAYHDHEPVAFIEYVSANNAPIPIEKDEKTALITCINKPTFQGKGVGAALVQAAIDKLRKLDVKQVKTLVGRDPQWITGNIYLRMGFRVEKTFLKPGGREPLDLLTLNLEKGQMTMVEPTTIKFDVYAVDSLPVHVVCFGSGQCPFNALIESRIRKALEKLDPMLVVLEVLDSWENCRLARVCGAMYSDLLINGRMPFLGPPSEEQIEKEIRKEIERVKALY